MNETYLPGSARERILDLMKHQKVTKKDLAQRIYRSMLNAVVALNATFEIAEQRKGIAIQNLNATIREEDRLMFQETVADESDLSPEQRTIKAEVLRELYSGMNQLPERERCYVLYRYGFLDSEDHTLTETAKHFHLTESRAREIEETALTHLRDSKPHTF